jgi:ribosome recycling factor
MIEETYASAEHRMKRAVEFFEEELASVRAGRASPSLLDKVLVDYFGNPTPVNGLATVNVPEPRMIVIQPWDKSTISAIEKAIQKSDLGLNPSSDGTVIRLVLPQLNEERRKELVKTVHKRAEDAKVAIRNCRRDATDELKKLEKNHQIGEDDQRRGAERLQKLTDSSIVKVDEIAQRKEREVLEV